MFYELITKIEAQEFLSTLSAHDYPNFKQSEKVKFHREITEKAFPPKKEITTEDFARLFNGR